MSINESPAPGFLSFKIAFIILSFVGSIFCDPVAICQEEIQQGPQNCEVTDAGHVSEKIIVGSNEVKNPNGLLYRLQENEHYLITDSITFKQRLLLINIFTVLCKNQCKILGDISSQAAAVIHDDNNHARFLLKSEMTLRDTRSVIGESLMVDKPRIAGMYLTGVDPPSIPVHIINCSRTKQ